MARPIQKSAPAKIKMRKNHGPKRKHPKGYNSTLELWMSTGLLLEKARREAAEAEKYKHQ